METVQGEAPNSVPSKDQETQQRHGLVTPDATPAVDDARIEADRVRRATAAQQTAAATSKAAESQPASQSHDANANENRPDGDSTSEPGSDSESASSEQIELVERVMRCSKAKPQEILGLAGADGADEMEVLAAFKKVGCATHPEINKAAKAYSAHKKVCQAARDLKVDDDFIDEMKDWDGKEDILNYKRSGKGHWISQDSMDGDRAIQPTPWHTGIYQNQELTQALFNILIGNDKDASIAFVQKVNQGIEEHNEESKLEKDAFIVPLEQFCSIAQNVPPLWQKWKVENDEEALKDLQKINGSLQTFVKEHQLPSDWIMDLSPGPAPVVDQPLVSKDVPETRQSGGLESANAQGYKFLKCYDDEGYVFDGGIKKEVVGYVRLGGKKEKSEPAIKDEPKPIGHRLLLKETGKNGFGMYEFVRCSQFGRKYVERNKAWLKSKEIVLGTAGDLQGKDTSKWNVAGVAPVRRFTDEEPRKGWKTLPLVYSCVSFAENLTFKWYARSLLGSEIGQAAVDSKLDEYVRQSGQKAFWLPLKGNGRPRQMPSFAVDKDEDDGESISLGSQDTSDEEDGRRHRREDLEDEGEEEEEEEEVQSPIRDNPKGRKKNKGQEVKDQKIKALMKELEILQTRPRKSRRGQRRRV